MATALREPGRPWQGAFIRLDAEYLLRVRPLLGDAETRVYEAIVFKCDGWNQPTSSLTIAEITGLHVGTVRRTIQRLEEVGLVRGTWVASRTSPHGQRRFKIVREYDGAVIALRRSEMSADVESARPHANVSRDGPANDHECRDGTIATVLIAKSASSTSDAAIPSNARAKPVVRRAHTVLNGGGESPAETAACSDVDLGREEPQTCDATKGNTEAIETDINKVRGSRKMQTAESSPGSKESVDTYGMPRGSKKADDVSSLQPFSNSMVEQASSARTLEEPVPNELVELARSLWSTDVSHKAARRYIGQVIGIGEPVATTDEVVRYLQWSAATARVQRARFPIAVACMPEEFGDWLTRYRRFRAVRCAANSIDKAQGRFGVQNGDAMPKALGGTELARRAEEFCRRLGLTGGDGEPPVRA